MSFLRNMEEKREREEEELAEIRKKEREEDREEILKLMEKSMSEKVVAAVEPLSERTGKVEEAQLEMKDQVNLLMKEVGSLKEKISEVGHSQKQEGSAPEEVVHSACTSLNLRAFQGTTQESELAAITSLSRRTVGLQKIDKSDLVRMRQEKFGGAKTEEEEKLLAVREYLELELKISRSTVEKMKIEKIFPPASAKDDHLWLYVTFESEASVQKIYEKTRIMRKESRILTYIPKEFHNRFGAIREIGDTIRSEEKFKTRIKMGFTDLQLHKKEGSAGKWVKVPLPSGLPPIELGVSPTKSDSGSPAPGRPGQEVREKRSRESFESPTGQANPKAARRMGEDVSLGSVPDPEVRNEELQGTDTTGKVVEEESYCPASPAPRKSASSFPYSSPILSKTKNLKIHSKIF